MDAKEAVKIAKHTFADLFTDEPIQSLGLEEVVYDEAANIWRITLGFYRTLITNGPFGVEFPTDRIYKVVALSGVDGRSISVTNRELTPV